MKKRYKFWLGILISGVFFVLFIWGIDFREVWKATKEANYFYVFLAVIVNVFTFMVRAERWAYLLEPIKKVKFKSLFSAVCIGFMGNSLLPMRAGEFIRAYVIGKREEITKTGSFATIVSERLFDGLTLLIMLIIVVSVFPFPKESHGSYITLDFLRWAIGITSFFYGIVIVTLILLSWKPHHVWQLMRITLFRYLPHGFIQKIEEIYRAFLTGLESLKRGRHMLAITIYSIMLWLVTAFGIYLLFPAFSLQLDFMSAILIMVVVAVVIMLPSSPGFVGTFHWASSETLILIGVNIHIAKTFAIVHHACCIVPVVLLGLVYLMKENISFKEIRTSVSEQNMLLSQRSDDHFDGVSRQNGSVIP